MDILDPVFELSAPPTQPTGFASEPLVRHIRLLTLSVSVVMGPAPPEDAFLSERKDVPPRFVASWTAGLSVPRESGEGPGTYPWEV